ncbi:MAG: hypothetical protein K2G45_10360 [Lachnospiraceae bacterium]|nr:hypothetical protein [Lachnospiraceae bacterium]
MKKNTFKKRIMATIMAMLMAVSIVSIKADAASVGTGTISTMGPYNFYVREAGNTNLLGIMSLWKDSGKVYNKFTAKKKCSSVTLNVTNLSGGRPVSDTKADLGTNDSFTISKEATNPTYIYGSCTVYY